ncbi:MAG: alpha/beta hydrolase [Candidatus Paceibacterota bacterium]|jgi:hypothetical protein
MKNKQQILLLHGGTTHPSYDTYLEELKNKNLKLERILSQRNWKNELQDQLGEDFAVYTPQMPNKQNAQYEEWKLVFEKIVELLDNNFILVGHSLGAIFIVKYLSENMISKTIKKTLLLGTPFDDEELGDESLCSFLRKENLKNFEQQAGEVFFYHSEDDFSVPFNHIGKYRQELPNVSIRTMKDRNHFLQEEVPELVVDIKSV